MSEGTIEINKLRIYAYHGVDKQERLIGNDYEVSIKLTYPISNAMKSDDLIQTLNYAEVIKITKDVMSTPSCILENVVERMRISLTSAFPLITHGKITVAKLSPPITGIQIESVAISFEW